MMIRNLKIMGLALVVVFAMSAVASSAASAAVGTLTTTGPTKLTGVNTAGGVNRLNAFGGHVECANVKYTGFKYNVTPHELIPNDVSTFTVVPDYGVCDTEFVGIHFVTTVDLNGCDYHFHLGETTGTDKYGVKVTLACTGGNHIKVTQYSSAANHTANSPFCTQTITEEATREYEGLSAIDNTNGTGKIEGTVSNIKADSAGSFPCPNSTTETASLELHITVSGDNGAGSATSISISHT